MQSPFLILVNPHHSRWEFHTLRGIIKGKHKDMLHAIQVREKTQNNGQAKHQVPT